MKKIFVVAITCLLASCGCAQTTTFDVEPIEIPKNGLSVRDAVAVQQLYSPAIVAASFSAEKFAFSSKRSFFDGVLMAYQNHYPMTFTPDAVWQVVSMGFARHVAANAEQLRSKFVDFEGKETLTASLEEEIPGAWEAVFSQFTEQIATYVGDTLVNNLTANFTTSTPTSVIASQITIMDAMKNYFEYHVNPVGCGVSRVTLEGSLEDWEKVLEKTQFLAKYDLDWWTKELKPILTQFIEAKKGNVDKQFWKDMVSIREVARVCTGETRINGWINKFYPYDLNGKRRNFGDVEKYQVNLSLDIVAVPFKLVDEERETIVLMQFQAGIVGWTQDTQTLSMRPVVGWLVNNTDDPENKNPSELWKKEHTKTKLDSLTRVNIGRLENQLFSKYNEISYFDLSFKNEAIFDPRLANIRIKRLTLTGKISPEVEQKYRELKNISEIVIN
ncbi:MAG: hypothetical protein RL757_1061, partial [Bacteroidota bacterium]